MTLWELLPKHWQLALQEVKPRIERIGVELETLFAGGVQLAPVKSNIFAALPERPEAVRVVVVGQDPYPTSGHATGLAFSVSVGTHPLPPTLRNILAELHADVPDTSTSGDLTLWRDQGVLLLNRVLTTEVGSSLAHQHLGWQEVTLEIVRAVNRVNPEVIGVLWGKHAQTISGEFQADRLVESVHPSPLSAYRGFFGSKPFSKVNQLLAGSGQSAIRW